MQPKSADCSSWLKLKQEKVCFQELEMECCIAYEIYIKIKTLHFQLNFEKKTATGNHVDDNRIANFQMS